MVCVWAYAEFEIHIEMADKLFIILLVAAGLFGAAACGEDEPPVPDDAISLNMMNERNGMTYLGGSDVYIDNAGNFTSGQCGIVDLGKNGGFDESPRLTQISRQVAVAPGHFYQVMLADDIEKVAGGRAFRVGSTYYGVFADSWITSKDGGISGVKVAYVEREAATDRLPVPDSAVEIMLDAGNGEYAFDKSVVIDPYYDVYAQYPEDFIVDIDGNRITFSYGTWTTEPTDVYVKARYESLYTEVHFVVRQ